MDAERPSALGDVDDAVDKLRDLADERRKLVNHDDQGGRAIDITASFKFKKILRPSSPDQGLAVVKLRAKTRQRSPNEVGAEVGDETHGVWKADEVLECGAALVVDDQEGDAIGAVFGRHSQHPRLQKLALS